MAKFLKSFFQPSDKRRNSRGLDKDGDEERSDFSAPIDFKRKLSISRSGRMKQAMKKRHSLSLELYGDENIKAVERPSSKEYHVHGKSFHSTTTEASMNNAKSARTEPNKERRKSAEIKTPEEEIDIAFQIIDKS